MVERLPDSWSHLDPGQVGVILDGKGFRYD